MARSTDDLSSPSEQERRLAGAASDEEALRAAGSLLSEEEKQRLAEPDRVISGRPGFTDHEPLAGSSLPGTAQAVVGGVDLPDDQHPYEGGVIERVEERVTLAKRLRDVGGVRVSTRTEVETEILRDTLQDTSVEVEHVPVGRFVEAAEEPRVEGDVTVVPVYEERLVVEKRLFLVEEVHLRRVARTREVEVPVESRRQVADVERLPPLDDRPANADTHQGVTRMMNDMTSGTRTVTAMFDNAAEAERAIARLRSAGVPDSAIRHTGGSPSGYSSDVNTSDTTYRDQHKGFFDSLADFFFPEEDRYTYAEGLSRGSHMVVVTEFDNSMHDTIVDILDDEGSVDLDARESEWRSSGWSGYEGSDYRREGDISGTGGMAGGHSGQYASGAAGMSAAATGVDMNTRGTIYDDGMQDRTTQMAAETGRRSQADLGSQQQGYASSGSMGQTGGMGTSRMGMGSDYTGDRIRDDGTVEVVEEELAVGKRAVDRGAVRVRSYVREEPVTADVDLRAERVYVERRPVNRAAQAGDLRDQTLEARETSEEAVVAKEARVVEEIGLRKESEVEHRHIQDTVRKTEVEIEDTRTGDSSRLTGDRKDRGDF